METTDISKTVWTPQIGDRVSLVWGLERTKATITANLGPLAGQGRTLWEVRVPASFNKYLITHARTDEMQPLPVVQRAKRVLGRRKALVR